MNVHRGHDGSSIAAAAAPELASTSTSTVLLSAVPATAALSGTDVLSVTSDTGGATGWGKDACEDWDSSATALLTEVALVADREQLSVQASRRLPMRSKHLSAPPQSPFIVIPQASKRTDPVFMLSLVCMRCDKPKRLR